MRLEIYLLLAVLLSGFAYIVFRYLVRRDYRDQGRLGAFASMMQLIVFMGFFGFPYLFNPPEWVWFWRLSGPAPQALQWIGLGLICLGFIIAFGTMAWFGIERAFGLIVGDIITQGPYQYTRNPQILGGYLLVIGIVMQWPSLQAVVWLVMYGLISHWMVITEEEHLTRIFGEAYQQYCSKVARYLGVPNKTREAIT
jgi:protein-S-isoprenylcysteine O-methyltransferase Ste14